MASPNGQGSLRRLRSQVMRGPRSEKTEWARTTMSQRRRTALGAVALGLAACAGLVRVDDVRFATDAGTALEGAAPIDGRAAADADGELVDHAAGLPSSLVPNGGFEESVSSCVGWVAGGGGGSIQRVSPGRASAGA